jgi:hypothetical protein
MTNLVSTRKPPTVCLEADLEPFVELPIFPLSSGVPDLIVPLEGTSCSGSRALAFPLPGPWGDCASVGWEKPGMLSSSKSSSSSRKGIRVNVDQM